MKKFPVILTKLLTKSFIGPFLGTFVISIFLFLMQFLWKYIGDLVGKGLEWYIILEFIIYSIPYLIPRALPLAVLLSSIMTFGNLGERFELVSMKSAGLSLIRIMAPMLLIMSVIAWVAFYSANVLIPKANLSWGSLFHAVTHKKPAMNIQDGIFFNELQGYSIRVGHKHEDNQTVDDILIFTEGDKRGTMNIIVAEKGKMIVTDNERFMVLTLKNGKRYQEMTSVKNYKKTLPHNLMKFNEYRIAIDLSELQLNRQNPELFKENYDMLNIDELTLRVDSLGELIVDKSRFLKGYLDAYFHLPPDSIDAIKIKTDSLPNKFWNSIVFTKPKKDSINQDSIPQLKQVAKNLNRIGKNRSKSYLKELSEIDPINANIKQINKTPKRLLEEAISTTRNLKTVLKNNSKDVARLTERRARFDMERHKKFALAFSCILLFFVGAPLGAIIRKGGFGLPMIIAILLFIVYYILSTIGQKLAREGVLEVWSGSWLGSLVFIPIALFLTYKASNDSKLFDMDSYLRFFRKLIKKQ